jgi:tetratricopeptide (TPR) repeat protein
MMILNAYWRHFRILAMGWFPVFSIACCVGFGTAVARAQSSQAWVESVERLRGAIKSAEAQHAGAAELGGLWLQLANRYQDLVELPEAEDAFVRSLTLLRAAGTQAQVADALEGMASLYVATGRMNDARDLDKKALAIYEALGDKSHAGKMHETIALAWLFDRHAREAEAESAVALAELQLAGHADAADVVAAHLAHSYALCFEKKCAAAPEEVNQAMEVVRAKFPDESLEMVDVLLTQGFDEWKTGAVGEGDRAMGEALRLARGLKALPQPVIVNAQLGVMLQYDVFLKETHRRQEAAQMEAEMGRLESAHPDACSGCTVSVAALGFMH